MVDLKLLNEMLLEAIDEYMDTEDENELALLEVLTDACMEVEEFLARNKIVKH